MTMLNTDAPWALPDPDTQAEFYDAVVMKRAIAFVIDSVLVLAITAALIPLTAFTAVFFIGFLYLLVNIIYRSVTMANRSATPGMRLMAIEFRKRDGEKLDGATAFLHVILTLFVMSTGILQLLSIVLMLLSPRGQGLPDMILGTAAINKPAVNA